MQIVMIQDKIVPAQEVDPVHYDRGIFFGDGVYEVMRSYNGKLFALEEHLERFSNSLSAVAITGIEIEQVRARVLKAFDAAGISDAKIYFHVTRGSAPRDRVWDDSLEPNFFLNISEMSDNSADRANGIAVSTHPDWRWKRCDIKSLNLLANVLAANDAARKGCGEAILVDQAGLITEGAGSAFFAIRGQTLQTAPLTANILPSITREFTLKAARKVGLEVVEKSLTVEQAAAADELLIASTTQDIVPVVKFDDEPVGDGKPGKYARLLNRQFTRFTA
ncbi:MAG: aminotransferase class IV [Phycisphaerales bacterium]|nr:MAG: aminotransferase class IV [Phycisphaerales bacterium]